MELSKLAARDLFIQWGGHIVARQKWPPQHREWQAFHVTTSCPLAAEPCLAQIFRIARRKEDNKGRASSCSSMLAPSPCR